MLGIRSTYTMAIQNSGKAGYVFLSFDSYSEFKHYYLNAPTLVPKDVDSTIGEVVRGSGLSQGVHKYSDFNKQPIDEAYPIIFGYELIEGYQCPYFDFDGELSNNEITVLANTIKHYFKDNAICVNLYNSNGKRMSGTLKHSYHIVIKGVFVRSHLECKELTSKLVAISKLPSLLSAYDSGVYTSKRNLRMLGSRKLDDRRTKVFDRTIYRSDNYRSPYIDDSLYMSLAIGTEDCVLYDVNLSEKPIVTNFTEYGQRDDYGVREEHISEIKELMEEEHPNIFTADKLTNGFLTMKRKMSSRCKICDRVHDSIGCFITRIQNEFYFNCYRMPKSRISLSRVEDEDVEITVVSEIEESDGGETSSSVQESMIKTKRGEVTLTAYIDKLKRMHSWSQ